MSIKELKYKCEVCGYEYKEELAEDHSNVKNGTAFSDLSHNWRCPVCGADKDRFFQVIVPD